MWESKPDQQFFARFNSRAFCMQFFHTLMLRAKGLSDRPLEPFGPDDSACLHPAQWAAGSGPLGTIRGPQERIFNMQAFRSVRGSEIVVDSHVRVAAPEAIWREALCHSAFMSFSGIGKGGTPFSDCRQAQTKRTIPAIDHEKRKCYAFENDWTNRR